MTITIDADTVQCQWDCTDRQAEEFLRVHEAKIYELVDEYIEENFPTWEADLQESLKDAADQHNLDVRRGK